jgi:hypothetical protein
VTQFHEVPLPATVRIQHFFTQSTGKTGSFKTYWLYDAIQSTPSNADMQALAILAANTWGAQLAALIHPATELTNTICRDLTTDTSSVGEHGSTIVGTRAGQALSPEITCLVNYLTQRAYRGGKPRTNLPFGVETDLDATGESWNGPALGAFDAGWRAYLAAIAGSTNMPNPVHVVASYYSGHQENPNVSIWAPRNVPAPRVDTTGANAGIPVKVVGLSVRSRTGALRRRVEP